VRPELPIVLMSGYSGAQLTERARAAGAGEVLRKPLVRRDIAEALARALQNLEHVSWVENRILIAQGGLHLPDVDRAVICEERGCDARCLSRRRRMCP